MMSKAARLALALSACLLGGCARDAKLERRLLEFEGELNDVRQSQQLLGEKLEEIQIQISVMKQLLGQGQKNHAASGHGSSATAAGMAAGEPAMRASDDDLDEAQIAGLFRQAAERARQGRFPGAYNALKDFIVRFPDHTLVAEALMLRGRAAFSAGEVGRALSDFLLSAAKYPEGRFCAEALLMAGRCCEMLARVPDAKNYYLQLVQSFPLSAEAAEANQRLEAIR